MLVSRMYLSATRIHSKFLFPSDSAPGIIAREVLRKESCQVLASLLCIMPQLCIVSYFDFRRIAIYCLADGRAVSLAYGLRAVLSFISMGTRAREERSLLRCFAFVSYFVPACCLFQRRETRTTKFFQSGNMAEFLSRSYTKHCRGYKISIYSPLPLLPHASVVFRIAISPLVGRMIGLENKTSAKKNRVTRWESRGILH